MNTIIFDYRTHTYYIQRDGQPVERAKMNPRAAAHIAVILAAAGWQVQHSGLIPTPTAADSERLDELAAVAPEVVPAQPIQQPAHPRIHPRSIQLIELAAKNPDMTFTVIEAAELLDAAPSTINYHIKRLNLRAERKKCKGTPYAIRPSDLLTFVRNNHLR